MGAGRKDLEALVCTHETICKVEEDSLVSLSVLAVRAEKISPKEKLSRSFSTEWRKDFFTTPNKHYATT